MAEHVCHGCNALLGTPHRSGCERVIPELRSHARDIQVVPADCVHDPVGQEQTSAGESGALAKDEGTTMSDENVCRGCSAPQGQPHAPDCPRLGRFGRAAAGMTGGASVPIVKEEDCVSGPQTVEEEARCRGCSRFKGEPHLPQCPRLTIGRLAREAMQGAAPARVVDEDCVYPADGRWCVGCDAPHGKPHRVGCSRLTRERVIAAGPEDFYGETAEARAANGKRLKVTDADCEVPEYLKALDPPTQVEKPHPMVRAMKCLDDLLSLNAVGFDDTPAVLAAQVQSAALASIAQDIHALAEHGLRDVVLEAMGDGSKLDQLVDAARTGLWRGNE